MFITRHFAISEMHDYGYKWEEMLPLTKEKAAELFKEDVAVYAVIGLIAVMVFVMLDVIRSTKNYVIMDMTFINMSGNNV